MEKISQGNEKVSQIVAEVCGVNQTTVHSYINELVNKEIIRRVKRGKIFTNNKFDDSRIIDIANRNIPGTCVIMSLSNFTQKQAHEVFDSFSDKKYF